jgi:hypothetical protein
MFLSKKFHSAVELLELERLTEEWCAITCVCVRMLVGVGVDVDCGRMLVGRGVGRWGFVLEEGKQQSSSRSKEAVVSLPFSSLSSLSHLQNFLLLLRFLYILLFGDVHCI